ncbi:MAG: alpha/beta fold hydrolase [Planctomycetes bacterium]|nr:alpha/beta fold hydrolase [Planctomycetota bacterium]
METRHISFDDTRIAVHIAGSGPLAVLLHAYPLDHRMWLDLMTSPLAESRTFAAIDLRGHGDSPWCGNNVHSMEMFADDVSAVIRTLTDDPVDVVGVSMGGYVAQALVAHHGDLVSSLALVDTRGRDDTEEQRAGRDAAIATLLSEGRSAIAAAMSGKLIAARPADDPHHQMLRARIVTMIESLPTETILADLRGLRDRRDRTESTSGVAVPVLVAVGEHDPITPPSETAAWAATIPGALHVVVPGAGHLPPMENPAEFVRVLTAFWDGIADGDADD